MSRKLGIIAGSGNLPLKIAKNAKNEGRDVFIVGIKGFAEDSLIAAFEGKICSIGEVGKQISALKAAKVDDVCFAGVVKRPDFKSLKLDTKGMLLLPKVISAASKGDDALLTLLVGIIENEGFRVVGAEQVSGDLLSNTGPFGSVQPTEEDLKDLKKAANIASEIGRLDIGQGAVVCRGLVLAVEAQEGTDEMLERCASLPENLRGSTELPSGVLVKIPKPGQERRIDLPTVGMQTLQNVKAANLAGVGIEAEGALILDRDAIIEFADQNDIWVFGFTQAMLDEMQ
jgi:DUF1009 family protein